MLKPTLTAFLLGAGATGALALSAPAAQASGLVAAYGSHGSFSSDIVAAGYRDRYGYRGHRGVYNQRHYGSRRHLGRVHPGYRGVDPGAAIAAGILGFATGAIASGIFAAPSYPSYPVQRSYPVYPSYRTYPVAPIGIAPRYGRSDLAYCARKYRSFDPASFTYLGYDGRRHYCRLP